MVMCRHDEEKVSLRRVGSVVVMIGFMCTWCVHVFLFLSILFPF